MARKRFCFRDPLRERRDPPHFDAPTDPSVSHHAVTHSTHIALVPAAMRCMGMIMCCMADSGQEWSRPGRR